MKARTTLIVALLLITVGTVAFFAGKTHENDVIANNAVEAEIKKVVADNGEQNRKQSIADNWKQHFVLNEFTFTQMWPSGFTEQVAIVENKTDYTAEKIQVTITYTLANGNKQQQIETIADIKPGEIRNFEVKDWTRGTKVKAEITAVRCSAIGLAF